MHLGKLASKRRKAHLRWLRLEYHIENREEQDVRGQKIHKTFVTFWRDILFRTLKLSKCKLHLLNLAKKHPIFTPGTCFVQIHFISSGKLYNIYSHNYTYNVALARFGVKIIENRLNIFQACKIKKLLKL